MGGWVKPQLGFVFFCGTFCVIMWNVIAVYIITGKVLIKTSAEFEYHYNLLLSVSCYLDTCLSASVKIQVLAFEVVC